MSVLPHILKKEFRQVFRNRPMLLIIFVLPIVQLLILVNAADFEIKNINMIVEDGDHSHTSRELIGQFDASPYFRLVGSPHSVHHGLGMLDRDQATVFLRIPQHFERDLLSIGRTSIALDINGIDGQAAGLSAYYVNRIVGDLNRNIMIRSLQGAPVRAGMVQIKERYWYNPDLEYKNTMLPGILVLLVTMVGMFLASMNIVREMEIGTIEQINVTPIRKWEFIVGKLFPFWVIGMFELAFGLTIGVLVYSIPVNGNVGILIAFAGIYLPVILGMGLLVSTLTQTQQQAMFVSWFFMVIFLLMSGLFTPIENMPVWAQNITLFNPIAYFIDVIRLVLLKGSSFSDVGHHFGVILLFAVAVNTLAVLNYRKRAS